MEDEIKGILLVIAKKLYKTYKLLSDNELQEFIINIDNYSFDEISRYACYFFDLANKNYLASISLKNDFKEIYDKYLLLINKPKDMSITLLTSIKNYLLDSNYDIYMSNNFENINSNDYSLFIPKDSMDIILEHLYGLGAEIYIKDSDEGLISDAQAVINNDLFIKIYVYEKLENGNIIINRVRNNYREQLEINLSTLNIGYNNKIQSLELLYLISLFNGSALDYVEIVNLKGKINLKKVKELKQGISYRVEKLEEVKVYGLQKTS